ncbi:hypothetical protein P175DRAFT_0532474 [Aspergillus ochraceoroseus IBT 24754]|uniref:DUF1996 domain-containing protein n=2 Tax=Aspergillus ochraceoroseus TaxID=138278 RepID=A0A2T5LXY3_9EURO|nr:uncharacterized protein P175DRAFT_0532474 [Aspergillus ochraceoroseus IBT 24754]KKK17434.1 hypothetical protein AOCH_006861 [Aspergillus ochraceoroseus]PTU21103.1 hypothetical protein P175DRAFT_0532474 [Aspergillus ochraceoroseus IBT 24754]
MRRQLRLNAGLVASLIAFSGVTDAFWRLPCHGRSGLARIDPLVSPGEPSYHVHTVHGSSGFSMNANMAALRAGSCTSCAVKQDRSAYWAPALYFIDEHGDSEIVKEVGGLLAYYLLYGEKVEAFPDNFHMIAGDPFLRNFTWPVPDPPKSDWTGDQLSQASLRQKALGFNCLNYAKTPEPSLGRHFLPNKTYLDEHCTDGVRFELMFPSCWNGKDVDSADHRSHVAYPSLVMDGVCPEGFETRVVSLFFETIWDTYAFKGREGYFALSTGDPTGYGYHGDFMHGWEPGVLQKAVKTCTNPSGQVSDCPVFDLQSDLESALCTFDVPEILKHEDVTRVKGSLPNKVAIEWGPEYAFPVKYVGENLAASSATTAAIPDADAGLSVSANLGGITGNIHAAGSATEVAASTTHTSSTTSTTSTTSTKSTTTTATSTSTTTTTTTSTTTAATTTTSTTTSTITSTTTSTITWIPTPTTSYVRATVTREVIYVEQEIVVLVDENNHPLTTETGGLETLSTAYSTITRTVSTVVTIPTEPPAKREKHDHLAAHKRHHHGHSH